MKGHKNAGSCRKSDAVPSSTLLLQYFMPLFVNLHSAPDFMLWCKLYKEIFL